VIELPGPHYLAVFFTPKVANPRPRKMMPKLKMIRGSQVEAVPPPVRSAPVTGISWLRGVSVGDWPGTSGVRLPFGSAVAVGVSVPVPGVEGGVVMIVPVLVGVLVIVSVPVGVKVGVTSSVTCEVAVFVGVAGSVGVAVSMGVAVLVGVAGSVGVAVAGSVGVAGWLAVGVGVTFTCATAGTCTIDRSIPPSRRAIPRIEMNRLIFVDRF
jgi:hypothetical protein